MINMTDVITKAKFRLLGFGLVVVLLALVTFLAFIVIKVLFENKTIINTLLIAGVIIIWFIVVVFFGGQCRRIKIYSDRILYINLVFPFINKTRFFKDYDYITVVQESSNAGTFDSMWLISNNKLKDRISSFYYSNYNELENSINIKNTGNNSMGMFKQLACTFGYKIK